MLKYNYKTISFIVPTKGRNSLQSTLNSIKQRPGDEVLVIQHNPPSGNWGNAERQEGIRKATCDYLAFIDDDDVYVPMARDIMDKTIKENIDSPILFKMQYPDGSILWNKKWVKCGNVSTQMILVPNNKSMLSLWVLDERMADFHFINNWKWPASKIVWKNQVIALLGHNDCYKK